MNSERLAEKIATVAARIGCDPDDIALELLRLAEVAVAEGKYVYGKRNIGKELEKRTASRASLLRQVLQMQERQQALRQQMSETLSLTLSVVAHLRRVLGMENRLESVSAFYLIKNGLGYARRDGKIFQVNQPLPKELKPKEPGTPDLRAEAKPEAKTEGPKR